jgi:excinuclease ABC subunit A
LERSQKNTTIESIVLRGARQNNLKNLSLELPVNKLIVITGVSGSGKSTLAFDTIYSIAWTNLPSIALKASRQR